MDEQETLGLENLGLEKPAAPRNASCANQREARRAEDKAHLQSELQQASGHSGQHTPSIISCVPSYQPLPLAPLGSSANTLNHSSHQDSPVVSRCQLAETSVSPPGAPSVSRYQPRQGFASINGPSTISRVTATQPRLLSRGPKSTPQKPALYSKANLPLTEPKTVQPERWTGSPPAKLRMAVSQSSRSSQSAKSRDLEGTPPATHKPSHSIRNSKDDLIHLPAPVPTSAYLGISQAIPKILSSAQRLLLVLDLNGTLLYRHRASQSYTPRPCLTKFLNYAFASHSLLVWSSAQPHNVRGVCARLFTRSQRKRLLAEWGRDTLGLTTTQYKERVQVYKRLDRIWGNESLQHSHPGYEGGERWGQHNTVLIDDSALKASAQPFNHVEVPEFVWGSGEKEGDGSEVLGQIVGYLEEARKWSDVSGFLRHAPFEIDAGRMKDMDVMIAKMMRSTAE